MALIAPAACLGSWMQGLRHVEPRVGSHILGNGAQASSITSCVARAEQALLREHGSSQLDWHAIASRPVQRGQRA